MKIKIKNSKGELIDHDSDVPVPDHHGVVTSMMIMDSTQRAIASSRSTSRATITDALGREAGHRPGHAYIRDDNEAEAAAQASYAASKARLQDAWRGPNQMAAIAATWPGAWHNLHATTQSPDRPMDVAEARAAHKARIQNMWRSDVPVRDARQDNISDDNAWPGPYDRPHADKPADFVLPSSPAREAYIREISNAWKTGKALSDRPAYEAWPQGEWRDRNPSRPPPDRATDSAPDSGRAWREMVARQESAWKTPAGAPR